MRTNVISFSDIQRCPIMSLAAEHYRDDGSCKCTGEVDEHAEGTPGSDQGE